MTTPITDSTPTSVYRYYDERGLLLYVGITKTGVARNRQHNSDKEWWPWVSSQRVEHCASRDIAHAREIELISEFTPPFNTQHNREHAQLRQLYVTLRESGAYDGVPWGGGVIPADKLTIEFRVVEHLADRTVRAVSVLRDALTAMRLTDPVANLLVRRDGDGHITGSLTSLELNGPVVVARAVLRNDWWLDAFTARLSPTGTPGKPIRYKIRTIVSKDARKVRRVA